MPKPAYFPILDLLRLVASLFVVLAHSTVFFNTAAGGVFFGSFMRNAGYYGVIFFYTLSGFLITYLLLLERRTTGGIAVGRFYVRRALRIWPLYYLIVLLSFFVLPWVLPMPGAGPAGSWRSALVLYILFLPNMAGLRCYIPTCFHTYTIGYEEQFYLIWPLVLRKAGKGLAFLLVSLFVLPFLFEVVHLFIIAHDLPLPGKVTRSIRAGLTFISYSNVPAFIAGAGGALFYVEGKVVFRTVAARRVAGFGLAGALLSLMYFGEPGRLGYVNLISALFILLIVTWIRWNPSLGRPGKAMVMGGKISYGIYIYHPAMLIFTAAVIPRVPGVSPIVAYVLYLMVTLLLLIPLAYLSHRYFERFFLRMRERFHQRPVPGQADII